MARKLSKKAINNSRLPDFEIFHVPGGYQIRTFITKQPLNKIDAQALGLDKWSEVMDLKSAVLMLAKVPHKNMDPKE